MAKKIFVSYKYADTSVYQNDELDKIYIENKNVLAVTPRSYLNGMENVLENVAIQKWEKDNEDLSVFKEETIESKLKDKIYDSTIKIVLISPKMKEEYKPEEDQWIPWEISYSLKKIKRNDRYSRTNAMIAVVLPDINNSYEYCVVDKGCSDTLRFSSEFCFEIIGANFFNKKEPDTYICNQCNSVHYKGYQNHCFVYARWCDFIDDPQKFIERAQNNQRNIEAYILRKTVNYI